MTVRLSVKPHARTLSGAETANTEVLYPFMSRVWRAIEFRLMNVITVTGLVPNRRLPHHRQHHVLWMLTVLTTTSRKVTIIPYAAGRLITVLGFLLDVT